MRRLLLVGAATASLALALVGSAASRSDEVIQFSTPSKNIGCVYAHFSDLPGNLRCDIRSGLKPKPIKPRGCDLDWGDSLSINRTGRVHVVCHGDTALGGPPLAYGRTWRHNGFSCVSATSGLTCRNLSGHGFFLSRERARIF
ncbi:MAG: DUF6636 domain-containing protein [Gaiellaceae bacterium]